MVEDIITALSRIRWLFVIARNSSFTYKGRAVDVKQVGRELGVRYVLEGSVRKAGEPGAHHRAADRCRDRRASVGGSLRRRARRYLRAAGSGDRRASSARSRRSSSRPRSSARKRKPTESLDAYDYYLRGMANLHRGTREAIDEALPLVQPGARARPEFRVGLCDGGVVPFLAQGQRLDDRSPSRRSPRARAWPAGPSSWAGTMRSRSRAAGMRSPISPATSTAASPCSTGRSCSIPTSRLPGSSADSCGVWHGEPDGAIEHFARAMRLSPLDPEIYRMQAGTGGGASVRRALRRRVVVGGESRSGICRAS